MGGQTACALGTMEMTNPLLQGRWFIRYEIGRDNFLFKSVEIIFMVVFFFVRLVIGTYIGSLILLNPANNLEYKVMTISLYVMSWLFMVNIYGYFHYKYVKGVRAATSSEYVAN